jgi:hypothetical protein
LGCCSAEHEVAIHSAGCRRGGSLSTVVGLGSTSGDDRVSVFLHRVCEEVFEFSRFVAPESESGLIVALDQQAWAAEMF